ncbi:MAG: helix-turn-helix transcriptional regulator [Alphaproteobacteria bacterium]|nr:helix-turn-helix transcriptional regulator [Alphaproteobacteria bacterium]
MEPRKTSYIDAEIGRSIRARRNEIGVSQVELAEYLGITFQQLQKHEIGQNRVSATRLYHIAQRLGVPFDYFFRNVSKARPRASKAAQPLKVPVQNPSRGPGRRSRTA